MARTITDQEIALIKAMLAQGLKNTDIQFFFNRPTRPVNSGRISNIANGTYSNSASIAAATDEELNVYLAERSPTADVPRVVIAPEGSGDLNPVSDSALRAMFDRNRAGDCRLKAGETDWTECKQSFSLRNATSWLRAAAAFANNRGGYVFFGIAEGDADKTCRVIGLANDDFKKTDPGEIAARLRSAFDPTPMFQKAMIEIGGAMVGLLHIEKHPSRPIIATKNDGGSGEIKEGDIFYRYPGASRRISYGDLRAMLDERDARTRESILPMVRRVLELGPERAMIADLAEGKLTDGKTSIELSEELIERLMLVKEGEFQEGAGAPALRLIGDVKTATSTMIRKGSITRDDLRRDFLQDVLQADPTDYLRTAIDIPGREWIPLLYFASRAKMTREDLLAFIVKANGTPGRKDVLTKRLRTPDAAYVKASGPVTQLQQKLAAGDDLSVTTAADARMAAAAVIGLSRPLTVNPAVIRALLMRCLDLIGDSGTQVGRSEVRKAIARLDELLLT